MVKTNIYFMFHPFPQTPLAFFPSAFSSYTDSKHETADSIIWHFSGGPQSCLGTRAGMQKGGNAAGTENQWDCKEQDKVKFFHVLQMKIETL